MKKTTHLLIFPLLLVALLVSAFTFSTTTDQTTDKIEIIFNAKTTFDDLTNIRTALKAKNIDLEYKSIEFSKWGSLRSIDFKVDCNDGFAGGAKQSNLTNKSKFGFYRDYSSNNVQPFGTGDLKDR